MFFPEQPKDPQLAEWRDALYHAITARGWPKPRSLGVKSLSRLRKTKGAKEVQEVLNFYIARIGEDYIPRVRSAEELEDKFEAIKEAMDRSIMSDTEVDEGAYMMAERLEDQFPLPVEIKVHLAKVLHKTLQNWIIFAQKLAKEVALDPYSREADFVLDVMEGDGKLFVTSWIAHISRKYGRHEHYSGPVMMLAFHEARAEFRESFWHKWANDWCGNPVAFDGLLDKIIGRKR